ncbi:MAG: sulfite exporter TauE/SafE family protein [Lachnospiraceae bacterium]|nr:sulfite exporter TauE/SafE family protein [Lachnospiraceae bacterium]
MTYVIFFIVCFGASVVGAICGIGGGVIIKPVLDSFGILSVTAISFLSGCTVLSMTTYSVIRNRLDRGREASGAGDRTRFPLAMGAAVGGLIGKEMFSYVKSLSEDPDRVGAVQAACLLLVTIGTLIYTIFKAKIKTHQIHNAALCVLIGLFLGVLSSFLGIGGGPINLVVLFYFFSMTTKQAAEDSLYIIFFSQAASLLVTVVTSSVPAVEIGLLLLMVAGGILGGVCGRHINKRIDEKTVDRLFIGLMVVMILINIYNIYKYI